MKATGMIRRIDELGRVVIPKEIRRTMRLKEGEELEIFAEDEGLVLKKYSALSCLAASCEDYAVVLAKETGGVVLICDRDQVLCNVGERGSTEIPPALERLITSRRKGVVEGEGLPCPAYAEPVLLGGDLLGGVALAKPDLTDEDIAKVRLVRRLLESQLERD